MTAFNLHKFRASQEQIVALIAAMVFIAFAIRVPDFLSASNITALIQNVSVLGILATGMALSVLGRNIDFSKQGDREAIGNALIQHIRKTGGCDVAGDKLQGCK